MRGHHGSYTCFVVFAMQWVLEKSYVELAQLCEELDVVIARPAVFLDGKIQVVGFVHPAVI